MNSKEKKDQVLRFDPLYNYESPFLEDKLFRKETVDEWESRLEKLESENPFQTELDPNFEIHYKSELTEEEFDEEEEWLEEELFDASDLEVESELDELQEEGEDQFWEPHVHEEDFYDEEYTAFEEENEADVEWEEDTLEDEAVFSEEALDMEPEIWDEAEEEYETYSWEESFYPEEESAFHEEFFGNTEEAETKLENPVEWELSSEVSSGITAFTTQLGIEWAKKRQQKSPSATEISNWLLKDYKDTLEGARLRYKNRYGKGRFTVDAISRAWMISRREQMNFVTSSTVGIRSLQNFAPPSERVSLVSSKLIDGSDKAPVAPIIVRFVENLKELYKDFLNVTNYRGHGGGKFNNRGYSLDLWLKKKDERGFYIYEDAIKLLRAVDQAAGAVQAEWRMIYNDFSIADAINRETGKNHLIFVGKVRRDRNNRVTGLNWHGPEPLILHFHLDLAPRKQGTDSGATSRIEPASAKPTAELVRFAQRVLNAAEGERLDDDSILGPLTRAALERFRKRYWLGTGNQLDSATQIALAQRALEKIAQQSRFSQIGVLDDNTKQALASFKAQHGLGSGSSIDASTRLALVNALAKRTVSAGSRPPSQSQPSPKSGTGMPTPTSGVSFKGGRWGGWRGRQTMPTAFISQSGIAIKDKYKVAAAVAAKVETGGAFDKVQMYDKGILSWGIKQWTLHRGSLQGILRFIHNKLTASGQLALWTKLFPGIDFTGNTMLVHGTAYTTPRRDNDPADLALRKVFRGKESPTDFDKTRMDHWLTVFARTGRHPTIQKLQIEYAVDCLKKNLNKYLGKVLRARRDIKESEINHYRRVGDYIESSPLAVTLFNGMETQNPQWTYRYLKIIVDRFAKRYGTYAITQWPSDWKETFSRELKKEFEDSGVACWGHRAIRTKSACKGRISRTDKILQAYKEFT